MCLATSQHWATPTATPSLHDKLKSLKPQAKQNRPFLKWLSSGVLSWNPCDPCLLQFSYILSGWEDTHECVHTNQFPSGHQHLRLSKRNLPLTWLSSKQSLRDASGKENAILPWVFGLSIMKLFLLKAGSCWCIHGDLMESLKNWLENMIIFWEVPCSAKNEEKFYTPLTHLPGALDSWPYYPKESCVWFNSSLLWFFWEMYFIIYLSS